MAKESFRLRFTFWLDMVKPEQHALAETIDALKQQRAFGRTVRDGIQLICDLRAGRLDLLFELFPWVISAFLDRLSTVKIDPDDDSDGDLKASIQRLEQLLLAQHRGQVMAPVPGNGGPKALDVPQVAAPVAQDDDLLTVKKAHSDGKASAENFLASAFAIAGLQ